MPLPNFLVIGDIKAGSTSLYHYLRQHPGIYMPGHMKELRYFAFDETNPYHRRAGTYRVKSIDDYRDCFYGSDSYVAIGEASPNYLRSPVAAARIQSALSNVRLICSLRNPADRLYSLYQMDVRSGETRKPFDEVVFGHDAAMIKAGFYYPDLKRYFDRFPANKLKIVLFEELMQRPLEVTRELYRFLEVQEDYLPDLTPQNEGGVPRNRLWHTLVRRVGSGGKALGLRAGRSHKIWSRIKRSSVRKVELDAQVRAKIIEICYEDIVETQRLTGRDLSGWL